MASAGLNRTVGTPTSRQKFTISAWLKKCNNNISDNQAIYSNYGSSTTFTDLRLHSSEAIEIIDYQDNTKMRLRTNRVFRDANAWYHVMVAVDTTLATANDRIRMWINGEEETSFSSRTNPAQNLNTTISSGRSQRVGYQGSQYYFNGLLAHVHYIDGTTYDASAFGETDSTTGIWKPKTSPSVTYGNEGIFLDFASSSDMGNDVSGNNNDLTVTGTITQTIDTPSNVFATWNPIAFENAFSGGNGNTKAPGGSSANHNLFVSTLAVSKGKYYFEAEIDAYGGNNPSIGIASYDVHLIHSNYVGSITGTIGYTGNGNINENSSSLVTGLNSYTDGDIIGVGLDLDNNKIYFYKNGTLENTGGTTITNRLYAFAVSQYGNTGRWLANFGNGYFGTTAVSSAGTNSGIGTFEYDVPSGYKALCTKNINAQEYS